jgi:hypothetical protein
MHLGPKLADTLCAAILVSSVISRGALCQATLESSVSEERKRARNVSSNLAYNCDFHGNFSVLLHAAKLRHGTDCFNSLPKEGMLRIFSPEKIRRLRPGANPRSWVPEASMLTTRPPKPLSPTRLYGLIIGSDRI